MITQTILNTLNTLIQKICAVLSIISKTLGITELIPETIDDTIIIGASIICGLTIIFLWRWLKSKDRNKHTVNLVAYIIDWSESGLPIIAIADTKDKYGEILHKIFLENIPEYTYPYPLRVIRSTINSLYNQACYIMNWDETDWRNDAYHSDATCAIQISLSYVPDLVNGVHGVWIPISTYGKSTVLNNPNYTVLCLGKPYIIESHPIEDDVILDYIFVPLTPVGMLIYLNHHAERTQV